MRSETGGGGRGTCATLALYHPNHCKKKGGKGNSARLQTLKLRSLKQGGGCVMWIWICMLLVIQGVDGQEGITLRLSVVENSGSNLLLGSVRSLLPTAVTFTFSGKPNSYFSMDSTSGDIRTKQSIDREATGSVVNFAVVGSVDGTPSSIPVEITVLDENDNTPTFTNSTAWVRNITVLEGSSSPNVYTFTAYDPDEGANSTLQYALHDFNASMFSLSVSSSAVANINLLSVFDREATDSVTIRLTATDGGLSPKTGQVTINFLIQNVNDNQPEFDLSIYRPSMLEDAQPGITVVSVIATDGDISDPVPLAYSFADPHPFLQIDSVSGHISVSTLFSSTEHGAACDTSCPSTVQLCITVCRLRVHVYDSGGSSGTALVELTVLDSNDHHPIIEEPRTLITVSIEAQPNKFVSILTVTDNDKGINAEVSLEISSGNELGRFQIGFCFPSGNGQTSCTLLTTGSLDQYDERVYNLGLRATDHGTPSLTSERSVSVSVLAGNDHFPAFVQKGYVATVSEFDPPGTFVAAVTATDTDEGVNGMVNYAIGSGDIKGFFKLDATTGLLIIGSTVDADDLPPPTSLDISGSSQTPPLQHRTLTLSITAYDLAPERKSTQVNVTITIIDENDQSPRFVTPHIEAAIAENQRDGTLVAELVVTDGDSGPNGTVQCSLSSETKRLYPGTFEVAPADSGRWRVTTRRELDREMRAVYKIEVEARDGGETPRFSAATISLNVTDVNDNPPVFYPTSYRGSVARSGAAGTKVARVHAEDADAGKFGEVTYEIRSGAGGRFTVDSLSGDIVCVTDSAADVGSFQLVVTAVDGGLFSARADVTVTVEDETEQTPVFTNLHFSFDIEEDRRGQVGTVQATAGSVPVSSYFIVDGDPFQAFSISPQGLLSTSQSLDHEQRDQYLLTVCAVGVTKLSYTTVTVTVLDINDNPPVFANGAEEDSTLVPEDSPVGSTVYVARAYDPDSGNNAAITYTLSSDPDGYFELNAQTGVLTLRRSVVFGRTFVVRISAEDGGTTRLAESMSLSINVEDVNNHSPVFEAREYKAVVKENSLLNEHFLRVVATDNDFGENARLTYDISAGNEAGVFGIFPDGTLYVAKQLDREAVNQYELTVEAADHGTSPQHRSTARVSVKVGDDNDNAPVFTRRQYEFHAREGEASGTYVGTVSATDADFGRNSQVLYYLDAKTSEDHIGSKFEIDPVTGDVTTKTVFDRETIFGDEDGAANSAISVPVVAYDGGLLRLNSTATVSVFIDDTNDHSPEFLEDVYRFAIMENAQVGDVVGWVRATDADAGRNSFLSYAITAGNEEGAFSLGENHTIVVSRNLNREKTSRYELTLAAYDNGVPQLQGSIRTLISVSDYNDNQPRFTHSTYNVSVAENERIGSIVGRVEAVDEDIGINADILYSLRGTEASGCFELDGSTGEISLMCHLDYENKGQYVLGVRARDYGIPTRSDEAMFVLNVHDVNEHAPEFISTTPGLVRVSERAGIGAVVTTLTAMDEDKGAGNGDVRYRIVFQNPPDNSFSIDHVSGDLRLTGQVDFESVKSYGLLIEASDLATAPRSTQHHLTVEVTDWNDNKPVFVNPAAALIALDASNQTVVTTFECIDADTDGTSRLRFGLVGPNDLFSLDLFSLDPFTGVLSLKQLLSPSELSYTLTVRASDRGSPEEMENYQILTVIPTALLPQLTFNPSSYSREIVESLSVGREILTVAVSGSWSSIEYHMTSAVIVEGGRPDEPRGAQHLFSVDKSSGRLTVSSALDYDFGARVVELEVTAFQHTNPTSSPVTGSVKINVTILDVNDVPPVFTSSLYHGNVPENMAVGELVVLVHLVDTDSALPLNYTITKGNEGGAFRYNPDTGYLEVARQLDYETWPFYSLILSASDGIHQAFTALSILVTDINDSPPQFENSPMSFDIPENIEIGGVVGRVKAFDLDGGQDGTITYSLLTTWKSDHFLLDETTGVMTIQRAVDYEMFPHYIMEVEASDGGSPPLRSNSTIYINLIDLNDNAPQFDFNNPYSAEVSEGVAIGSEVIVVTATDADTGVNGHITYTIVGGNEGGLFGVDEATGNITTNGKLDREKERQHVLIIMCSDSSQPGSSALNATTEVTIQVTDINDNAPMLSSPSTLYVSEWLTVNSTVALLHAKDEDFGANSHVSFSLRSTADSENAPFQISVNGEITLQVALDREMKSEYTVLVQLTDGGLKPLSRLENLTVIVVDENDHAPVFSPGGPLELSVAEDVTAYDPLLILNATDADEGLNGVIHYYIESGDDNEDWILEPLTGVLHAAHSVDYERQNDYNLTVQAVDSGRIPLSSTLFVRIRLTDVNDVPPSFLHSPYRVLFRENSPSLSQVIQLTALSGDYNGGLLYNMAQVSSPLPDAPFNIDSATGVVSCTQALDREALDFPVFEFRVQAETDGPAPTLSASTLLTIIVSDDNDNAPYFDISLPSLSTTIPESEPVNSPIFQVSARDADDGDNAEVRYSLEGAGDKFVINAATGWVYTAAPLDRERQPSYPLLVVATDNGLVQQTSSVTLLVTVSDIDDTTPTFPQAEYRTVIRDPLDAGSFVFGVSATDPDLSPLTYRLSTPHSSSYLNIDTTSGIISAATTLRQADMGQAITYTVHVTDSAGHSASTNLTISFTSTPVVNFPVFTSPSLDIYLNESTLGNSLVTTVSALTPQPSPSNQITYHLAGGNTRQSFTVSKETGEVRVGPLGLDFERISFYQLWVEARDSNPASPLSVFLNLNVSVIDVNDHSPEFSSLLYRTTYQEEQTLTGVVSLLSVSAVDVDSGENGRVTYSIIDGNKRGFFAVDSISGEISSQAKVDREATPTFMLTIEASDQGEPPLSSRCQVQIDIDDVDDEVPRFVSSYSFRVSENSLPGLPIGYLQAVDGDIGEFAKVVYSLNSASSKFSLSPEGNITLAQSVDREDVASYSLTVLAQSFLRPELQASTTATITVMDFNDNAPAFRPSNSYQLSFSEGLPSGSEVGEVRATDDDSVGPNSQLVYRLEAPSSNFQMDRFSGKITSLRPLEYKPSDLGTENIFVLPVACEDRGSPSLLSHATVAITITDANDHAPAFTQMTYESAIAKNTAPGTTLLTLVATDADSGVNAEVKYEVVGGSGQEHFKLHPVSGKLSTSRSFEDLLGAVYTVEVKATDMGLLPLSSSAVTVTVSVIGVNEHAPRFTSKFPPGARLREDIDVGHKIGQVEATDEDVGINGEIRYTITAGNSLGWFMVNETSGELFVASPVDYDGSSDHHLIQLTVSAADRALLSRSASLTFRVQVVDTNDNVPQFDSQQLTDVDILENEPAGTNVVLLKASDKDTGDNAHLFYSIDSEDSFSINSATGQITTRRAFNYETPSDRHLTIIAGVSNPDRPRNTNLLSITVRVRGVNEFVPQMVAPLFHFTVSEQASVEEEVGKIVAFDQDSPNEDGDATLLYYLVTESNDQGFSLDHDTGILRVSRLLDREHTASVSLSAFVKNPGPIRGDDIGECTIEVLLLDANDAPEFNLTLYEAQVIENAVSAYVTTITASDRDKVASNSDITYSIGDGGDGKDLFEVDLLSGVIRTSVALDREQKDVYEIVLTATDQGTPPLTGSANVRVSVLDVNDERPYFTSSPLRGTVRENSGRLATVILLRDFTVDDDLDPNRGPFSYRMDDSRFSVDLGTGLVTTKQELNYEDQSEYSISVTVSDGGTPPLSSSLSLTVEVLDVNDPPRARPLTVVVRSVSDVGIPAGMVLAYTPPLDEDASGSYTCSSSLSTSSPVTVPESGQCVLVSGQRIPPNWETITNLSVVASDSGLSGPSVQSPISVDGRVYTVEMVTDIASVLRIGYSDDVELFLKSHYVAFNRWTSTNNIDTLSFQNTTEEGSLDAYILLPIGLDNAGLSTRLSALRSSLSLSVSLRDTQACPSDSPLRTGCKNGGSCLLSVTPVPAASSRSTTPFLYHSTDATAFTSLALTLAPRCECPQGYRGVDCSIEAGDCTSAPCQNGAECILTEEPSNGREETTPEQLAYRCECSAGWRGEVCDVNINECLLDPSEGGVDCLHGGECVDEPGSFRCNCSSQWGGNKCEVFQNVCVTEPEICGDGGKCVSNGTVASGFFCECSYGYSGSRCQFSSMGFQPLSYLALSLLSGQSNVIHMTIATVHTTGLLLYQRTEDNNGFVGVEIFQGRVRGVVVESTARVRVEVPLRVDTGDWFRVTLATGQAGYVSVDKCTKPQSCQPCDGSSNCKSNLKISGGLLRSTQSLLVGGVRSSADLAAAQGHLTGTDFIGCMAGLTLNQNLVTVDGTVERSGLTQGSCPAAEPKTCSQSCGAGVCVSEWYSSTCKCEGYTSTRGCTPDAVAASGFTFSPGSSVTYKVREQYRRQVVLDATEAGARRRRRQTPAEASQFSLRFRSGVRDVVLLTAKRNRAQDFYVKVKGGQVIVTDNTVTVGHSHVVSDGQWHNITVISVPDSGTSGGTLELSVDTSNERITRQTDSVFSLTSSDIEEIFLGGTGFEGCISDFILGGESLPVGSAVTARFAVSVSGEVTDGCSGCPVSFNVCGSDRTCEANGASVLCVVGGADEPGGLSDTAKGAIIVTAVVVAFLIVLVVAGILVRRNMRKKQKKSRESSQSFGNLVKPDRSDRGSTYAFDNYERGVMADEIDSAAMATNPHQLGAHGSLEHHHEQLSRLDMDVTSFTPPRLGGGVRSPPPYAAAARPGSVEVHEESGLEDDPREFYDLDEASIAPSDCDIGKYYKEYREGKTPMSAGLRQQPNGLLYPHMNGRMQSPPLHADNGANHRPQSRGIPTPMGDSTRPPSALRDPSRPPSSAQRQPLGSRPQSRAGPTSRQATPVSGAVIGNSSSARRTPIEDLNRRMVKDRSSAQRLAPGNSESSLTDGGDGGRWTQPQWGPAGVGTAGNRGVSHTPRGGGGPPSAGSRPHSRARRSTTPMKSFEMTRMGDSRHPTSSSSDEPHSPRHSPEPATTFLGAPTPATHPSAYPFRQSGGNILVRHPNNRHPRRSHLYSSETNDSSSGDEMSSSSNDSFTASEYEHDIPSNGRDSQGQRGRGELGPPGGSMMFTKLQEVEDESDSADPSQYRTTFSWEGMRNVDNSLNQFIRKDSDSNTDIDSVTKLPKRVPGQTVGPGFRWDHFLNWGPKFEKLVGVFKDISELPTVPETPLSDPSTEQVLQVLPLVSKGVSSPIIVDHMVEDEYV